MHGFSKILFEVLAPCQWSSLPDSHPHKLIINYSMIVREFRQDLFQGS